MTFAKTETLAPGVAQELELRFDLADCASYAEAGAQWRLDAGRYLVRVGNSCQNTEIAASPAAFAAEETLQTLDF